ncbi:hypothetical protein MA16_Dca000497 [Dendrobium catenatum]|uniref:Retrovirus-related Pol polyprotein from transposon TNT 1-94 n=1 Tax=Dendrobium catenatum TaxID=906689 RepID=A0A2I0WU45_9ASPA|nr:hypothetical protein MA16_Dca000497 [Dendrobium catenatum]
MVALTKMYEKSSASNKVFLMKKLFNMKIMYNIPMEEHLNNLNTMMSQLCSIGINFDDEVRAFLL